MTPDRTRWCELLVGLDRVEVLDVVRRADRLFVTVESIDRIMGCGACGTKATIKDRDRVQLADLPAFGCPVILVWLKRRWRYGDPDCGAGTWTEDRPDIAPARSTMTRRAGVWATTQVGRHVHSVAWAAKELGVTGRRVVKFTKDPGDLDYSAVGPRVGMHKLAIDVVHSLSASRVDARADEPGGSAVAHGLQVAQQGVDRRGPRRLWPVDDPVEQVRARLLGEARRTGRGLEGRVEARPRDDRHDAGRNCGHEGSSG